MAWTVRSTNCSPPLVPTFTSLERDRVFLPERFLEGAGQFVAQPLAGHGKDVPVGLAGRRLQVFARPPADVEDVALVVDQHGRRGVALQDQLIRQRLETDRRFRRLGASRPARRGGRKRGGKLDRLRPQAGLEPPVRASICRPAGANRSVKPPMVSALPRNRMPPGFRL